MKMLLQIELDGNTSIVSWLPNGKAFKVHNKAAFSENLMPTYFKTNKYKSFHRNLNLWGFESIVSGPNKGVIFHPWFVRGQPSLCHQMSRKHSLSAPREAERRNKLPAPLNSERRVSGSTTEKNKPKPAPPRFPTTIPPSGRETAVASSLQMGIISAADGSIEGDTSDESCSNASGYHPMSITTKRRSQQEVIITGTAVARMVPAVSSGTEIRSVISSDLASASTLLFQLAELQSQNQQREQLQRLLAQANAAAPSSLSLSSFSHLLTPFPSSQSGTPASHINRLLENICRPNITRRITMPPSCRGCP